MLILLVDDDADQLAIRELLAVQSGFEVLSATSAEAALAATRLRPLDCAVLDLRLPDESAGRALIRELKQLYPEMRIAILTGASQRGLDRLPERALVDEICQKGQSSLPALLTRFKAEAGRH